MIFYLSSWLVLVMVIFLYHGYAILQLSQKPRFMGTGSIIFAESCLLGISFIIALYFLAYNFSQNDLFINFFLGWTIFNLLWILILWISTVNISLQLNRLLGFFSIFSSLLSILIAAMLLVAPYYSLADSPRMDLEIAKLALLMVSFLPLLRAVLFLNLPLTSVQALFGLLAACFIAFYMASIFIAQFWLADFYKSRPYDIIVCLFGLLLCFYFFWLYFCPQRRI